MFIGRRSGKAVTEGNGGVLRWEQDRCMFCGCCVPSCEAGALLVRETSLELDRSRCSACGACARGCPTGALSVGPGGEEAGKGPGIEAKCPVPPVRRVKSGGKDT